MPIMRRSRHYPARDMVDHIQSIRDRPDLRLDPANLQALCWPCRNAKTNRQDGGFGLPRRPQAR